MSWTIESERGSNKFALSRIDIQVLHVLMLATVPICVDVGQAFDAKFAELCTAMSLSCVLKVSRSGPLAAYLETT